MDPIAIGFTAVVIAAGVVVLSLAVRSMNAVEEAWSKAAEQLRFVHSRSEGRELRGVRGRYPVVVDAFTRGPGAHEGTYSRITLDTQGRIPVDLELKPESSSTIRSRPRRTAPGEARDGAAGAPPRLRWIRMDRAWAEWSLRMS